MRVVGYGSNRVTVGETGATSRPNHRILEERADVVEGDGAGTGLLEFQGPLLHAGVDLS